MKHTLASLVIGLPLVMGATTGVWAQDYRKGLEAAQKGDFVTALQEWRPLAELGHAEAQTLVGAAYLEGSGVTQNYKKAAEWFHRAAELGNSTAQYNLGVMYDSGQGVVQDYKEAAKWYRKAAEQGNSNAQNNLGALYADGAGVTQDNVMAHMWYNIAASNSSTTASKNRNSIAKRMTAEDISKAQQMARECVAKTYKRC